MVPLEEQGLSALPIPVAIILAHHRNEVRMFDPDCPVIDGTITPAADQLKHPKTYAVLLGPSPWDAALLWLRRELPWFVPHRPGVRHDAQKERRWIRGHTKGLWAIDQGGVRFADPNEGFWYRMYRG